MFERTTATTVLAFLLVVSAAAPAATAMVSPERTAAATGGTLNAAGSGYAGAHVSFDANGTAILDYQVDGEPVFEKISVQSQNEARSELGLALGADIGAVTDFTGAQLNAGGQADTSVRFTTGSGASVRAHDNGHGSLVVAAENGGQYVGLDIGAESSAQEVGNGTVVVSNGDGSETTILVAGDGSVTVNEAGNVTAELESQSRLVVRSYEAGRTDTAQAQEELISSGTAVAQVYVDSSAQASGEAAADVVHYDQETAVEVTQRSADNVELTVDRTAHQGKVVITTLSNASFAAAEDVQVTVDGEAAARASSVSELQTAANGGESSKFMVQQASSAQASADVLVGVNHFSTRTVGIQNADAEDGGSDGSDASDGSDENDGTDAGDGDSEAQTTSSGSGPGFGLVVGALALIGAALIAVRRH